MNNHLENAVASAGFSVSDTPPSPQTNEATTSEPTQPVQESVEQSAPVSQGTAPSAEPQPEVQPGAPVTESYDSVPQNVELVDLDRPRYTAQQEDDMRLLSVISERLGTTVSDFDTLTKALSTPAEIDARVAAINDFVKATGRGPEDWYEYQKLNPSEMDDVSAVRNSLIMEHSNLSPDEVNLLMNSKYKLNDDFASEDELAMAKLSLKMDAESARQKLNDFREKYNSPASQGFDTQSPITEEWVRNMSKEVSQFEGLVFDLPSGKNFTFGIDDKYRQTLVNKNSKLEEFFDDYVFDDNTWNYEKLNAHRALIDNIDNIVNSVYRQGLSDGQRKVVETAANIQPSGNKVSREPSNNPIADQLRDALGGSNRLSFKF